MKILKDNILFSGMSIEEIDSILSSADHTIKSYTQGEVIVHQGDILENIGIILSGSAVGKKYTPDGEEIIVSNMSINSIFGDVLSGAIGFASPVTVQSKTACQVLFVNYQQLLFSQSSASNKVLQNMIQNISRKYFAQNKRMDILMLKSVRSKVLSYLEWQSTINNSTSFEINLDRRLLADFLGVERSALSRELSRMKNDGLIDYHKSSFTLLV